jgi:oligopeptide/dipeptide ABC transporter ATP-binding protein
MLLPEARTTATLLERISEEVYRACRQIGVTVIGGHTEIAARLDRPILVGSLIGEVDRESLVTPQGARAGDRVLLTKGVAIDATAILAREFPKRARQMLSVGELGRAQAFLYDPGISVLRDARIALQAGQVLYDGRPIITMPEFHHVAQMIFQNPYASLNPRKTVRDILAVPLRARGLREAQAREAETIRLLRRVGLHERHLDSYPHQFSGGQRQRIGVARAIAMQPRFIVADEPVSSLDVSIQAQVLNLLAELQEEYALTYLFISHDLSVVGHVSDRVAVMYLGRIVEEGPTEALFANPLHPYTQALLAAAPRLDKAQRRQRIMLPGGVPSPINPPSGCRFHPRCFAKVGRICEEQSPPFFGNGEHRAACWIYEQLAAPAGAREKTRHTENESGP